MAKPLYFSFVVHNHQPVGNLPWVIEEAFEKAYEPFITFLERNPDFPCVLHYSGSLLDFLEERKPEFLDRLAALVRQGQVELLTGASYEPIAALIPERDLIAQTRELSRRLLDRFDYSPRGFWLAERVWEPHLASAISSCEVDYTLIDSENLVKGGIEERSSRGFFIVENVERPLHIFPINQAIRRAIPFELPEKVVETLLSWSEESPGRLVVWGDDGEKLGAWPGTHKWVYEEGWLEGFADLLRGAGDRVRPVTLRDYFAQNEPLGRAHVPAGSYGEMMEWSGGDFRNFFIRYQESNWMHERMLSVSEKVAGYARQVEDVEALLTGRVSLQALKEAQRDLWQAQCNCAYWHGVFGGLYLPPLRRAVYQHLLAAERTVGKALPPGSAQIEDFDRDGNSEIRASNAILTAHWLPSEGGALCELDFLPKAENLTATLRRRREKYHEGSEVIEDWHGRYCFLDHFLRDGTDLAAFSHSFHAEQGDFVNQPYAYRIRPHAERPEISVISLSRAGHVWVGDEFLPMKVTKEFSLPPGKGNLEVAYSVVNPGRTPLELWFGVEMNFLLSGFSPPDRFFEFEGRATDLGLDQQGERTVLSKVGLCDRWAGIKIEIAVTPPCDLWFFPVKTQNRSEEGIAEVYQGTCLLFHRRITLPAEKEESQVSSFKFQVRAGGV